MKPNSCLPTTGAPAFHPFSHPTTLERKWLLISIDAAVCMAAVVGAFWFWSFTRDQTLTEILSERWYWMPGLVLSWCILAWMAELYESRYLTMPVSLLPRLLVVCACLLGGYLTAFFIIAPRVMLVRLPVIYFLVLTLLLAGGWRWGYLWLSARGMFRRRALIVGAGWAGRTIAELLQQRGRSEFELVGFVDDDPVKLDSQVAELPVVGTTADVLSLARKYRVEVIILAVTHEMSEVMFEMLLECQSVGLPLVRMPDLYRTLTGRVPVEHIRQDWLLFNRGRGNAETYAYRVFVHLLDGLFVLGASVFLLLIGPFLALLIKLTSPGPVFYRQTRLGRMGRPFELFKFRSMVVDAEANSGAQWAALDDPRVTSVGRLLRYTRLDELPQILNILRGDIHLVGPRPERPEFMCELEQVIPYYRARLTVKPGLTGWAQVEYDYGYTLEGSQVKLEYDLYYIQNRSILLDVKILLKTVAVVLTLRGT